MRSESSRRRASTLALFSPGKIINLRSVRGAGLCRIRGIALFGGRGNLWLRRLRRCVFLSDLDLATQNRAIFDDDAPRLHIACNSAGARNVDALALERANHFTVNDNFGGFDFCGNTGVGTDSETAIGNVNISFKHAIQEEIPPTRYFSFDPDALAHAR